MKRHFLSFILALVVTPVVLLAQASTNAVPEGIVRLLASMQPSQLTVGSIQTPGTKNAELVDGPRLDRTKEGFLRYLGAAPRHCFVATQPGPDNTEAVAQRFLNEQAPLFGVESPAADFVYLKTKHR